MVVNTPGSEKKTDLPGITEKQSEGSIYTTVKTHKRRKCCFVTSILFNVLLLAGLVVTCVYLHRYKREACRMRIRIGQYNMNMYGIEHDVDGCNVYSKDRNIDAFDIPEWMEPVKRDEGMDRPFADDHDENDHRDHFHPGYPNEWKKEKHDRREEYGRKD